MYTPVIKFVKQRHRAWLGRPVKDDIVRTKKFTNVFRVLDRGSQYLMDLMDSYDTVEDRVALSYFYRQVNRPDTMDAIINSNAGYIPTFSDITSPSWYESVVAPVVQARPGAFLNGAYIILIKPGDSRGTLAKMQEMFPAARGHLKKLRRIDILEDRVAHLRKTPGLGPFLAMQISTDLGYCTGEPDQENDFILAGPGSRKGCGFISDSTPEQVIRNFPVDQIPALPGSGGRPASLMDIQNVFCEYSKYYRFKASGKVGPSTYARNPPFEWRIPEQFQM